MKSFNVALLLCLGASFACSDPNGPDVLPMAAVAGTYQAVRSSHGSDVGALAFTTDDGVKTNWLERGAEIDLVLHANGVTTGRLFIPDFNGETGEPEPGSSFEADLAGSWSIAEGRVRLDHSADTFLRDMDFSVNAERLVGAMTFSDVQVEVILQRSTN